MRIAEREDTEAWQARPEDTFALLVGIDEYGLDELGVEITPTPGLGRQAGRIARALIGRGVPPDHIHLLTSGGYADTPDGVACDIANVRSIQKHLGDLVQRAGTFLWGHWAGHGYLGMEGHHLLLADAGPSLNNIRREDLLDQFHGTTYRHMYWTFDSCQIHYRELVASPLSGRRRVFGDGDAAQHATLISSVPGGAAPYRTVTGGTPLSAAVVSFLEQRRNDENIPRLPTPREFLNDLPLLLKEESPRSGGHQLIVSSPWFHGDHPVFVDSAPPTTRTELVGWHLSRPWEVGALNPSVSSASEVRLDLAWVADRACPLRAIVADPEEADLAGDLSVAEDELEAALRAATTDDATPAWWQGDFPRRREWRTVEAAQAADGLGDIPDGVESGFVIRVDVGSADLSEIRRVGHAVAAWSRRIEDAAGSASIIVAVRARLPLDGLLVAQGLTTAGGLQLRHAPAPAWSVYARTRPGAGCKGAPAGPGGLDDLIGELADAAKRRGVPLPTGLDRFENAPGDYSVSLPADVAGPAAQGGILRSPAQQTEVLASPPGLADAADAVLDDIEARVGALPFDEADEALLCAVRDLRPSLYPDLLDRYARRRTGPGWGVSLGVAAQFREDLAVWLAAAEGAGRGPCEREAWPPVRFGTTPADAVVLAIAAGATTSASPPDERIAGWRRLGTSQPIDAALEFLRAEACGCVLRTQPACAATAAILARAGFRTAADAVAPEWQDDASWIAIANSGRTTTLTAEIGRLMRADHPDLALAVLGIVAVPHDTSPQVSARVEVLRRLVRGREEGTHR